MKILLIYAELVNRNIYTEKKKIFWEPLGIAYLAAYLRKHGYDVDVLNPVYLNYDEEALKYYLINSINDYGLIGLSSASFKTDMIETFVKILRNSGYQKTILLGGLGPTCRWEEFLDTGIDCIILGEGEKTLLKVVRYLEDDKNIHTISGIAWLNDKKEKVRNGYVELIEDLNKNVFPVRDYSIRLKEIIPVDKIHIQIQTSRGCTGNCAFCSMPLFQSIQGGIRYRARNADNIVDEMEMLYHSYGFTRFDFMDENFFPYDKKQSLKKALELKKEIIDRKLSVNLFIQCQLSSISSELLGVLKSISCKNIFVGIDSFSNRELKLFNKQYDTSVVTEFMNTVISGGYSFDVDADYRVKIGFINFTPIVTLTELYNAGKIFCRYGISYKKLMRILKINGNSHLVERIKLVYSEFSEKHYFMNEEVEAFYIILNSFYKIQVGIRDRLRHMELILKDKRCDLYKQIKSYRICIDEQFFDFYFDILSKLQQIEISAVEKYAEEIVKQYKDSMQDIEYFLDIEENKYDYFKKLDIFAGQHIR